MIANDDARVVAFMPNEFGVETAEIRRIVGVNDPRLFISPRQLLLVRALQQCQLPARGDIQTALTQRIQQGMSVGIFIQVQLYRAQA